MAQHEGRALVLDVSDYRESSSLIRVFTETEGRISLVARGLKKPKGSSSVGTIQPFNLVRIRYFLKEGSSIGNLSGSELERISAAPRASLEAYAIASYWFEILKETSQPREAAADVFKLTTEMLEQQEAMPGNSVGFIRSLTLLCRYLGFGISWTQCVSCSRPAADPAEFSIRRGGILCRECSSHEHQGLPLKPDEIRVIRTMRDEETSTTDPVDAQVEQPVLLELLTLIHRYLTYHLEHPLKTFSFLRTTLSP